MPLLYRPTRCAIGYGDAFSTAAAGTPRRGTWDENSLCHHVGVLKDQEIEVALRKVLWQYRSTGPALTYLDYAILDLRPGTGSVDLELRQRDGHSGRLVIQLPSSGAPQFWLYATPADADDGVGQLLLWIDEEVFTSGLMVGRARVEHDGESYVRAAPYGWRLDNPGEHERFMEAAGPGGSNSGWG